MRHQSAGLAFRFCSVSCFIKLLLFRAWAASFQGLGDLPGGEVYSTATAVSADGTVVVGISKSAQGSEAFRWTAGTGMVGLGDFPGGKFASSANGISADGSIIVGCGLSANGTEAFRWTIRGGLVPLGFLPGGTSSTAKAVSADGRVIVGEGSSAFGAREAFVWTENGGMAGLGSFNPDHFFSTAEAVSQDGSAVVGTSSAAFGNEAFRWHAGGMIGMGDFAGGWTNSNGHGISANGRFVVGYGYSGAFDDYTHEAFRWTAESGLERLGFAPDDHDSVARAVSADGNIIVGIEPFHDLGYALYWDAQNGMRHLWDVLVGDYGLDLTGWQLTSAVAITPDGTTIVGAGINPLGKTEAWIATVNLSSAPKLMIRFETNSAVLAWSSGAAGFVLERTLALSASPRWTPVSDPATMSGEQYQLRLEMEAGPAYFRLRKN